MLDGLFRPRAVAVIGASTNPFSIGHIVVKNLAAYAFNGPIFPINPKGTPILSFKAYTSILEVPDPVDLVNISVKATLIPQVIEECGQKGVKFCIVHSAGFKEVGPEGVLREREMVALAHKYGMRVFGPNSQGIQNSDPEVSVYANFTFVPMKPGNLSLIAQGGGMGELLKLHLHNVGLGHRMYCSYGNECDLSMPEILEYYGKDAGTRAILMQTESFKDPKAFLEVARSITPHKPIFALKSGRTREGSLAVSSHTGTLVDQAAMASAMYKKAGVVEFHNAEEMIKAGVAASLVEPPAGKRLGIVTNTGGPGIAAVDEAVAQGLTLACWSEAGRARLGASLFAEASLGNPVDVVATAGAEHYFAAVDTLLKEDATDMVLVFFVTAPFVDLDAIAKRLEEATRASKKPVVVVIETIAKWYGLINTLRESGLPVYEFPEDGARALAALARHAELRGRKREDAPALSVDREAAAAILERTGGKGAYLSQVDAFALLDAYGIATPKLAAVRSSAGLDAAAKAVGFPCVLKVDSTAVVHKSDEGGVALNLNDKKALAAAYGDMSAKWRGKDASFVVQEQRAPGREVIVGATASPGLGSLVMFGLGGVFVEVMKDVQVAVAPLSRPEADELMRGIKGYPILEGVRGSQGVDLEAVQDLLLRVSRLAADFPEILELDINPVFAYPRGQAPVAVDVRIRVQ